MVHNHLANNLGFRCAVSLPSTDQQSSVIEIEGSASLVGLPAEITTRLNEFYEYLKSGRLEPAYKYFHTPRFHINYGEEAYKGNWDNYCLDPAIFSAKELTQQTPFWEIWVEMIECDPETGEKKTGAVIENWRFCMVYQEGSWKVDDYVTSTDYDCKVEYYNNSE